MNDRRHTDASSHAHKRKDDSNEFARMHQRLDDNDRILKELLCARIEMIELHKGTTAAINSLAASQTELINEISKIAGLREFEEDVRGMMRFMARVNGVIGIVWKPILFIAVVGGSLWLWATSVKPPP